MVKLWGKTSMTAILNVALSGLSKATGQAANALSNIVNASSTKSIDSSLVALQESKIDYQANAAVIKTAEKTEKSLLDIQV